jgi:thioesterase domain-containing protein
LERLKNKHIIETRHFNKIYQTLKNDKKVKLCEAESIDLNKEMLLETRNSLEKAIDEMKEHTEQRRTQFHEIWDAVVSMERTIHEIDESNDPATSNNLPSKEKTRMARFSRTDKNRRS